MTETEPSPGVPGKTRRYRVAYYAILREQARRDSEELESEAHTPRALYAELSARHGFQLAPSQLRAAINGDFAAFDAELDDGDEVVFIPPVAGGAA